MEAMRKLPEPPETVSGTAVLMRLLDGIAFRYCWATEGLDQGDASFKPEEGAMTLEKQLAHMLRLIVWTHVSITRSDEVVEETSASIDDMRAATMARIAAFRDSLAGMEDSDLLKVEVGGLPFWNLINGPLADALTHIGQINAYRRILGKPSLKINHFVATID
jgi:uncharacterized damage-inducible protein DinB